MIHLTIKIPEKVYIGVSGGSDSMAALDFCFHKGRRKVVVLNFNHGTEFGKISQKFVKEYCESHNIEFHSGIIQRDKVKGESPESYWRNERYRFFSYFNNAPIVLAHTLDDCVETYIFTTINGESKLIPIKRGNIIRPFLLATKKELIKWDVNHDVPFLNDPANDDLKYPRVRIRHMIIPQVKQINPGIDKVIRKKYLEMK